MARAYPAFTRLMNLKSRSPCRISLQTEYRFAVDYGGRCCTLQKNLHNIKA